MSTFKERLEEGLRMRQMTAADLSKATKIGEGAISQYRKGAYKASQRNLEKIAKALAVPIAWLMGISDDRSIYPSYENVVSVASTDKIPLIGTIACGQPILAIEEAEETVGLPADIHADFALRCKGDSMINARIFHGDIVYIKKQPKVENGEIAAVLIGEEATLKRVQIYPDHILLEAENPMYKPIVLWEDEMNSVEILGKAVAFTSMIH